MKNKYTKKLLMGTTFLSFGLYFSMGQALFSRQPLTHIRSLNDVGQKRLLWEDPSQFWKKPTQCEFIIQFTETSPALIRNQLLDAVQSKKPVKVLEILLLNRISPCLEDVSLFLHIAIMNNDFLTLAALVSAEYFDESGLKKPLCNINYVHEEMTPLMRATKLGRIEMVNHLIKEGADLFQVSTKGTILHFATRLGDIELTMKIIQKINDKHSLVENPNNGNPNNGNPNNGNPNNGNPNNGNPHNERKQFLNRVDQNGKTIFLVACENFLKHKLSPTLLSYILFWWNDYDFKNDIKQEQFFEIIKEILSKLKADQKWYNLRKNFPMDKKTREDLIAILYKMLEHMCNTL
ncbi:MAG: ankyrin repeat domain-containing protein [Puniceicoccales bacterium]|jgi:hypothetical protein|nr:ankyrin repeat domain-containing protein [Puniceicoccales bacterium]